MKYFYVVGEGNNVRSRVSLKHGEYETSSTLSNVSLYTPTSIVLYKEDEDAFPKDSCNVSEKRLGGLKRWFHTWKKLEICHNLVEKEEDSQTHLETASTLSYGYDLISSFFNRFQKCPKSFIIAFLDNAC